MTKCTLKDRGSAILSSEKVQEAPPPQELGNRAGNGGLRLRDHGTPAPSSPEPPTLHEDAHPLSPSPTHARSAASLAASFQLQARSLHTGHHPWPRIDTLEALRTGSGNCPHAHGRARDAPETGRSKRVSGQGCFPRSVGNHVHSVVERVRNQVVPERRVTEQGDNQYA